MGDEKVEEAPFDYSNVPPAPASGGPVEIFYKLYINDIYQVDSVRQVSIVDFVYATYWKDDRIVELDPEKDPGAWDAYRFKSWVDPEKIWTPKLEIMNMLNETSNVEDAREVCNIPGLGPHVIIHMEWMGEVTSYMNLKEFPFDRQTIYIIMRSAFYPAQEVKLVASEEQAKSLKSSLSPGFNIEEFEVMDSFVNSTTHIYDMMKDLEGEERSTYSDFRIQFELARKPEFYIMKVYFQFALLLVMDMFTFLLEAEDIGARTSVAITLFLTAVALHFAVQGSLPKISYMTRLDTFIFINYILMFLVYVEAFMVFRLNANGDVERAWLVDLFSFLTLLGGTIATSVWFLYPVLFPARYKRKLNKKLLQQAQEKDEGSLVTRWWSTTSK